MTLIGQNWALNEGRVMNAMLGLCVTLVGQNWALNEGRVMNAVLGLNEFAVTLGTWWPGKAWYIFQR